MSSRAPTGWMFVIISVLLVTAAQLLLKIAALKLAANLFDMYGLLPLGTGLVCYAISMLCWLRALESLPLGATYPLLGLSYPLVYLGALTLPMLSESLSGTRLAGLALIVVGIVLLAPRKN